MMNLFDINATLLIYFENKINYTATIRGLKTITYGRQSFEGSRIKKIVQ